MAPVHVLGVIALVAAFAVLCSCEEETETDKECKNRMKSIFEGMKGDGTAPGCVNEKKPNELYELMKSLEGQTKEKKREAFHEFFGQLSEEEKKVVKKCMDEVSKAVSEKAKSDKEFMNQCSDFLQKMKQRRKHH
uniref:Clone 1163 transcribed RNA sequence n=1 Tax=Plectreurys tristis TaxID=33319 RepID=A0A0C4W7W8_PLETR|nr:hypothetical protein [Plectreurys tristis]